MRTLPSLVLALCLAYVSEPAAQISHVTVSKVIEFLQTSGGSITIDPTPPGPNYGGPYGFHAQVFGNNIGGIAVPTFTGPINFGAVGTWYNQGKLTFVADEGIWRAGPNGNDWGSPTQADLNSKFPSGTYTMTVNGVTIPLALLNDAYPNTPVLTLSSPGGAWSGGKYVFNPSQPLTITTSAFFNYSVHVNGVMVIGGDRLNLLVQGRDMTPSPNFLTRTIPAGTYTAGEEYGIGAGFHTVVSLNTSALPDVYSSARYEVYTNATIKAESAAPVFPMTVSSQINATTSTAQATFQPRPQDAGTTQSVYVFALAPLPRVLGVTATTLKVGEAKRTDGLKTDAVPCVLAQVNSQGQLVAASASSLAAYSTGVLSAAGQTVQVLNNVSTPNVAGATMYLGYGTTSTGMINSGVNRSMLTIPGAVECRPEGPQTGWWWNTVEGGRGYSIEKQGRNLFMAAYFYDASGRATWLVASGPTSFEGALFTAPLYSCTGGVTLAGAYRANTCATAGNVTLTFNDSKRGAMVWPGGTVGIERFNIVGNGLNLAPLANQPENGWWWSTAEDGRGYFIEWQGGTADMAGYMYDTAGNPVWYITVISTPNPLTMNGSWWQYANGQTQGGAYREPTQVSNNVGAATISFHSATNATMTLPGGRQIALTRFRF